MESVRSVGMRDVAKLAGVSHQTVSRVLNKSPQVRAATRERVHAAMRELGYLPNMAARTLATRKSSTIGLMTVDSLLYGPSAMVYGIEEAAREAGHYVSIASAKVSDKATVLASIDRLRAQGVEGILAVAPEFDVEAVLTHVPADVHIVAVGSSEYVGVPSVGVDNVVGGAMATQHLLDLGHRTVHHLAGPDSPGANERIAGWRSALEAAQAPVPDDPLTGAWSADSGYSQGHRLAADPSVTAVFCANDHIALGFLHAVHEAGRSAPDDVSVVGFDALPEAAHYVPPLTSVRQDFTALGRLGLNLLLEKIAGRMSSPERALLASELVVRSSTAPPART